MAQDSFHPKRIVSVTFRSEKVNGQGFIILSRVVVRPERGFFQVEFEKKQVKDYQRRLTEAYRLVMGRKINWHTIFCRSSLATREERSGGEPAGVNLRKQETDWWLEAELPTGTTT